MDNERKNERKVVITVGEEIVNVDNFPDDLNEAMGIMYNACMAVTQYFIEKAAGGNLPKKDNRIIIPNMRLNPKIRTIN